MLPKDKGVKEIDGQPFIKMLDMPDPEDTSLSITITRGKLMAQVRQARWMGVKRIWIEAQAWGGKRDDTRGRQLLKEIQGMGFEVVISSGSGILSKGQMGLDAARWIQSEKVREEDGSVESQSMASKNEELNAVGGLESMASSKSESSVDSIAETMVGSKIESR
jgi:hypothetical protein